MFDLVHSRIHHRFNRRMVEWYLAFVMFLCGLSLMLGPTFEMAPYVVVKTMAVQEVWSVLMTAIGGVRLVVLIVNGALERGSPHLRSLLAFLSAIIWSGLVWGMWSFTPTLLGPFLVTAVLFEGVNVYRTAREARSEDDVKGSSNGKPR